MSDREAVDNEPLSVTDAIIDLLWNRAKPNPALTTSQKLEAIDPVLAEKYRVQKETRDAVLKIKADLEEQKRERSKTKADIKRGVMQIIKAIWPD